MSRLATAGLRCVPRAQFNVEFLNALNQVYFNNPNTDPTSSNFGKVASQNNLPRDIQLAAKIVF